MIIDILTEAVWNENPPACYMSTHLKLTMYFRPVKHQYIRNSYLALRTPEYYLCRIWYILKKNVNIVLFQLSLLKPLQSPNAEVLDVGKVWNIYDAIYIHIKSGF